MQRRALAALLVVLSLPLFGVPALVPVEDVRHHQSSPYLGESATLGADAAVTVVAYENLSDRGQSLYRATLENGGSHWVHKGEGAEGFGYPGAGDDAVPTVVVDRAGATDLPPADERHFQRYDLVSTYTERPPLLSGEYTLHLVALVLGFGSLLSGLYLFVEE